MTSPTSPVAAEAQPQRTPKKAASASWIGGAVDCSLRPIRH